jgi:transposase InsO family protein
MSLSRVPEGSLRGAGGYGLIIEVMVIDMNDSRVRTLEQVREFLEGTRAVQFRPLADDEARYRHVSEVLRRFGYGRRARHERGLLLRYLRATAGFSRAQLTRLVARVMRGAPLAKRYAVPAHAFARRFSATDIACLAEVDRQFDTLSGPATAHLMRRAFTVYDDARFERLAAISVSHLYNLRASAAYAKERIVRSATRATSNAIGTRKAPAPAGRCGFIRIDSVHQGDLDGAKGVYHINAVDCVTQWQVVGCCERISEAYLLPLIEQMFAQFPFRILSFHADNGSEYINARVAALLEKLRIELTKSRPRRSNDNALAETKNGAVVRKVFGYGHIQQRHAGRINVFCRDQLNPLLNLHRPCLFATEVADPAKPGRMRKVYRHADVMTPLEKLASLPDVDSLLRDGFTLKALQAKAKAQSDLAAAQAMRRARQALFTALRRVA